MKKFYLYLVFGLFFLAMSNRATAVCPVTISAGGPLLFCVGDSVLLSASSGTGYTYQWLYNGGSIPGATGQQYYARTAGNYRVTVTVVSPSCITTSNILNVTTESPLTITVTDAGFAMCGASTDILEVQYMFPGNMYQWYEDSNAIPGAIYSQLMIGHDGNFSCSWTNVCGTFTSPEYTSTAYASQTWPFIPTTIESPGSSTLCLGGSITMDQNGYGGYHQWYRDGVAIPGATAGNYTTSQPGNYVLSIGTYCMQGIEYFFTNFITVTQSNGIYPAASITAGGPTTFCDGSNVILSAATNASWNYQWLFYGSEITGATASSYAATAAGTYTCRVYNACDSAYSNDITVATIPTSVMISATGPILICTGSSATLTSSSPGPGGTYQWQLNGSNIGGATSAKYSASVAGTYSCVITNSCGSYTSNGIVVSVNASCPIGLQFDGSNDYVIVPNHSSYAFGYGSFTIEAWVKLDSTLNYATLFSQHNAPLNDYGIWIYFNAGRPYVVLNNDYPFGGYGPDLRDNNCHHVTITRSGGLLFFFIDGNFTASVYAPIYNVTTNGTVNFGKDAFVPFANFKGRMMEVRMWNIYRSTTDIRTAMNNPLSGTEPGLVGYWKLNDGTGQVVNDFSLQNNDGQLGSTSAVDVNDPLFVPTCALSACTFPAAVITAGGNTTFCTGGSVNLNANTGTGLTYQWKLSDNNIAGAASSTYVATASGNYTCVVTNSCGSTTSNIITVSAMVMPSPTIVAVPATAICQGTFVTLLVSSGPGYTHQWQLNGINISGATANSYSNTAPGNYTCVVSNVCGTATSNILTITILPPPTATITPLGNTVICSGGSVTFQANTGAGLSYQWDRDGSHIPGATSSSYTASTSGDYICIVTDACFAVHSNSITVTTNPPPPASITAGGNTTFCSGGTVTLSANTGTGLSYQWIRNGGAIFGSTSSSYIATTPGNYTCAVINPCGSTISNLIAVTVNPLPTANITASGSTTICIGSSVTLNANTGAGLTWQWKLNTAFISGATTASYAATAAGNYVCVVTNSCGSTTSNTIAVTVNTPPAASITAGGSTTFCSGGSVTLNANAGTGLSYQWKSNGSNIAGATSSSYSATSSATYTCGETNACGTTTSNAISVTVNPLPAASITAGGNTTFCIGGLVTLNANSGTGLTYQWKQNGSDIPGAITTSYVATLAGNYTCVVTNACGGTTSNTIVVTVNTAPVATITAGGPTSFCNGGSVTLNANTIAGSNYQWMLNGSNITGAATSSYTATSFGNYTCVITNSCGSSTSNTIAVTIGTLPVATITAGGSTAFCSGGSVILNVNTGTGLSYQWKLNGNTIAGATSTSYPANGAGSYSCVVTNTCGNTTSNLITVTVLSIPSSPGTISGQASGICGNTTDYTISAVSGATSYSWTIPGGVTINSGQGSASLNVTYPIPFSSGSISVNAANICGISSAVSLPLTSVLAPAGPILGLTQVCEMKSYVYSVAPVEGATNYTWTVPTKARVQHGQGSSTAEVKMNRYAGNITVTASNGCTTSATAVLAVTLTNVGCGPVHRDGRILNAEVYPNPFSTEFTLKIFSDNDYPCKIILRDITGRVLEQREAVSPGSEISFGNLLANGIYLAEVLQGDERVVLRVVKSE